MAHAPAQTSPNPSLAIENQVIRPQGVHKSASRELSSLQEQCATTRTECNCSTCSAISQTLSQQDSSAPVQNRGCKRKQSIENTLDTSPGPGPDPDSKRQQTFPERSAEDDPIAVWAQQGHRPEKQESPKETSEVDSNSGCLNIHVHNTFSPNPHSATPMTTVDHKAREANSAPYRDERYEILLGYEGSFMSEFNMGIADESRALCTRLLEEQQTFPDHSLFQDDIFEATHTKVHNTNEARVIQDITRLIVPSAETLATFGARHLDIVIESVGEPWTTSVPLFQTYPQPDYSVGFTRDAFTRDEIAQLSPFIDEERDESTVMSTDYMYFPFLSCEVKCGPAALDIADRQNAHSMTLAVRGVAELFRTVGRQDEVNRQILAFSVSHDHSSVRIYGHYPVIDGERIVCYRHPIRAFDFTDLDGRDKWVAYQFTKNVYDLWMENHFEKIRSAIHQMPLKTDDDLPDLDDY